MQYMVAGFYKFLVLNIVNALTINELRVEYFFQPSIWHAICLKFVREE